MSFTTIWERENRPPQLVQGKWVGDNRLGLVGNFRLDNRPKLLPLTNLPNTASDAELVFALLSRYGRETFGKLQGAFACVVWHEAQLWLARDPLGEFAVCYFVDATRCIASADIISLLAQPDVPRTLNPNAIAHYLCRLRNKPTETLYRAIQWCAPGCVVQISAEKTTQHTFWQLDPTRRLRYQDEREYAEQFDALLVQAVKNRLRPHQKIALSLSGGLDSALLAGILTEMGVQPLKTYSYVFDALTSCDERRYIDPLNAKLELDATYILGDALAPLSDMDKWPLSADFIHHDPYALLPIAVLNAAQQDGVDAVFNGLYGDHLFLGGRFWLWELLAAGRVGQAASWLWRDRAEIAWRGEVVGRGALYLLPDSVKRWYWRFRPNPDLVPALHHHLHQFVNAPLPLHLRQSPPMPPVRRERYWTLLDSMMPVGAAAARHIFQQYDLTRVTPYWDQPLVEFMLAIPAWLQKRPRQTKYLMRHSLQGRVPAIVAQRNDKTAFHALFARGVHGAAKGQILDLLQKPEVVRRGYVSAEWLAQARARFQQQTVHDQPDFLHWQVFCLEMWLRQFG